MTLRGNGIKDRALKYQIEYLFGLYNEYTSSLFNEKKNKK